MSLKIVGVKDAGDDENERLILKVTDDCNLKDFMVMDCTYENGQVSNKHRHVYFFPNKSAQEDEYVILFTRSGTNRTGVWNSSDDTVTHRFYWGLDTTIWNEDGDEALVLKYDIVAKKTV
ncbi:hypothetical protein ACE4MK_002403 [Escherichia coli]|uniref:hypothetical protein n=1 Tax=Enterobacteriaceae TaxID=543 RepID=UPI0009C292F8|nr:MULTISPECIES: hypothetical protein [Enterobacteriaceae]EKU2875740.1 hypothetical protein [Enterobacter cloacae]EKU2876989.1 hypothetical protein [Enterobacter cloacae]MDI4423693.1 hypothetical protein [Escherichia coli]SKC01956.1 hypothetical protein SAMN05216168_0289 [Kosakonia radicincitans]HCP4720453.1 hypothetical protein [Escherichia coli]